MVEHITLMVEGMTCNHCVQVIEENVTALSGVDNVQVYLENGTVDVEFNKDVVQVKQITHIIEEQGYRVSK